MKDENGFKPFIPADKVVPEVTAVSVILGILLAVLFGAANAYLGLRVGMTVSASIPAAVISMGVIRVILRRDSILENNMVQTIGSAGESVAAGAIFTLPALFMWMRDWGEGAPSLVEIALIALCGGVLGVLSRLTRSPLRRSRRLLKRMVSGITSAVNSPLPKTTTVRQTPFTATLSPIFKLSSTFLAATVR